MTKVLGVDLDSTLADIMPVFCDIVKEKFGKDVQPSQVDNWDFWDPVVGPDAKWWIFREVWARWRQVQPTEQNLSDKIVDAIGRGYEIMLITSTQRENLPYVLEWLKLHNIPFKSFVGLFNGQTKFDYKWNAIIDDNPSLAKKACQYPERQLFLYNQPWNQGVDEKCLRRVRSFDEMLQELE